LWGRHGAGIECGFFGALATLETGGVKLLSSSVEVDIGRRHLDCFLGRFSSRRWVRTRWRTRDGWRYVGLPLSKHRRDGSVPVRDAQAGRQPFVGILFPDLGITMNKHCASMVSAATLGSGRVSWVCNACCQRRLALVICSRPLLVLQNKSRRHQDMAVLWLSKCWSRAVSNED
jgi:hypothetical protein